MFDSRPSNQTKNETVPSLQPNMSSRIISFLKSGMEQSILLRSPTKCYLSFLYGCITFLLLSLIFQRNVEYLILKNGKGEQSSSLLGKTFLAYGQARKVSSLLCEWHVICHNVGGVNCTPSNSPCSLCWCWRLLLEWCERKILLAGWWLEATARVV